MIQLLQNNIKQANGSRAWNILFVSVEEKAEK